MFNGYCFANSTFIFVTLCGLLIKAFWLSSSSSCILYKVEVPIFVKNLCFQDKKKKFVTTENTIMFQKAVYK